MARRLELDLVSGETVEQLRERLFDLPRGMRLGEDRDYGKLTFEDDK